MNLAKDENKDQEANDTAQNVNDSLVSSLFVHSMDSHALFHGHGHLKSVRCSVRCNVSGRGWRRAVLQSGGWHAGFGVHGSSAGRFGRGHVDVDGPVVYEAITPL